METQNHNQKICAVTGRRPDSFPWDYAQEPWHTQYIEKLTAAIEWLIREEEVSTFVTGGALGIDLDVAEIVIALRAKHPDLGHILVLPYENQGGRYASSDKNRHIAVQKSSQVVCLNPHFTPWCMQQRNEYMVDNAHLVAAFACGEKTGGTYNTIRYAKKKDKPIYTFSLEDCLTQDTTAWIQNSTPPTQLKLI